jgi:beta-lactam-binding protein with PASTA domain
LEATEKIIVKPCPENRTVERGCDGTGSAWLIPPHHLPMRSVLRLLWMTSVLIIVALVSAVTAMQFAIHGREVTVPDLRGKTPAEARFAAEQSGLEVQIERQYYSPTVPEGTILSQIPAARTVVRRGWEVRLALSLGPQRVAIPEVVGASDRAAAINIAQRGLNLGEASSVELPGMVAGQVIAQDPPPNATDAAAPKISLLVTQEPAPQAFVMPSFVGQTLGSVTLTLKDSGFAIGKVTMAVPAPPVTPNSEVSSQPTLEPPGVPAQTNTPQPTLPQTIAPLSTPSAASVVISQDPAPGAKIAAGSAITFVVK